MPKRGMQPPAEQRDPATAEPNSTVTDSTDLSVTREQQRRQARMRVRFEEGWELPTDLLLAFAPDVVNVDVTTAVLLERFYPLSSLGDDSHTVDDETRRAALILLRSWCKWHEDSVLSGRDESIGPSEADINRAKVLGTNPYPNGVWVSQGIRMLFSTVCDCCQRVGWCVPAPPRITDVTEIRTAQQALGFIRAVEDWIQEKEDELLTAPPTEPSESCGQASDLESLVGQLNSVAKAVLLAMWRNGIKTEDKKKIGQDIAKLPKAGLQYNTPMKEALSLLQKSSYRFVERPGRGYFLTQRGCDAGALLASRETSNK